MEKINFTKYSNDDDVEMTFRKMLMKDIVLIFGKGYLMPKNIQHIILEYSKLHNGTTISEIIYSCMKEIDLLLNKYNHKINKKTIWTLRVYMFIFWHIFKNKLIESKIEESKFTIYKILYIIESLVQLVRTANKNIKLIRKHREQQEAFIPSKICPKLTTPEDEDEIKTLEFCNKLIDAYNHIIELNYFKEKNKIIKITIPTLAQFIKIEYNIIKKSINIFKNQVDKGNVVFLYHADCLVKVLG